MDNRHYPEEFKRDVVVLARKGEVSKKEVADYVGIADTTLHRWIACYDTDRGDRSGASSDELAELTSLRRRVRRLEQENEILRRATAYFAKDAASTGCTRWSANWPSTASPSRWPGGLLGLCRQAYYRWVAAPVSDRAWDDAHLVNAIHDVHDGDPEFGYRFITDELLEQGWRVGENRVARLCREHRIRSTITRKGRKTTTPGPDNVGNFVEDHRTRVDSRPMVTAQTGSDQAFCGG